MRNLGTRAEPNGETTPTPADTATTETYRRQELSWPGLVLWTGCFEGCWLLLVVLCPLARVLVG